MMQRQKPRFTNPLGNPDPAKLSKDGSNFRTDKEKGKDQAEEENLSKSKDDRNDVWSVVQSTRSKGPKPNPNIPALSATNRSKNNYSSGHRLDISENGRRKVKSEADEYHHFDRVEFNVPAGPGGSKNPTGSKFQSQGYVPKMNQDEKTKDFQRLKPTNINTLPKAPRTDNPKNPQMCRNVSNPQNNESFPVSHQRQRLNLTETIGTTLLVEEVPPASELVPEKPNNKKKKKTKEQRRLKREEATLVELYKPKDSRIRLIDSDVFKMLKGETKSKVNSLLPFTPVEFDPLVAATPSASNWKEFQFKASCSRVEFPSLEIPTGSSASASTNETRKKLFASTNSSSVPEKQEVRQIVSTTTTILPADDEAIVKLEADNKSSWPVIGDLFRPTTSTEMDSANLTTEISAHTTHTPFSSGVAPKLVKQKLSVKPLVVSLGDLLESSKVKASRIIGKQIAKKRNDRTSAVKRENHKLTMGNLLDSSGPTVIHRGKIKQKPKKPSKLKKAILKSRELRRAIQPTDWVPAQVLQETVSGSGGSKSNETNDVCDNLSRSESSKDLESADVPEVTTANSFKDISVEDKFINLFKEIIDCVEEESKPPPPVPPGIVDFVKLQIHNRKFRSYCDMFVSKELFGLVMPLMKELHRLQDRLYKTDPIKFKTKRRYVNGLKDVASVLKLNKAQLVILAPDIESNKEQGGLDDKVLEIISLAKVKAVPYIFSGNRYILGKCIMQTKSPVSAIAVIDKQSVEEHFNRLLEEAEILREKYLLEFNQKVQEAMANAA